MRIGSIFVFFLLLLTVNCGGGGGLLGDDIEGELDSVIVYVSPETSTVQADVIKRVDYNQDGICDDIVLSSAIVNLRVKVEPKPSLPEGVNPSPVEVEKVRIEYQARTAGAPVLSPVEQIIGVTVEPGTEVVIQTSVLSEAQVNFILNSGVQFPIEYYAVLYVTVRELYSDRSETITTGVNLYVGDFITEGEECALQ